MLVIFILLLFISLKSIIFSLHPFMIFMLLNFIENIIMTFMQIKMSNIVIFLNNLLCGPIKHNNKYVISTLLNVKSPTAIMIILNFLFVLNLFIIINVIIKKCKKQKIDKYTIYNLLFTFIYIHYSWTTTITTQFIINLKDSEFWILFFSIAYITLITFGFQAIIFDYLYGKKAVFYRKKYNWLIYYQKPYYKWFILYLFLEKIIYSLSFVIGYYNKIITFVLLNLLNIISLICHLIYIPFRNKIWNKTFIINKIILLVASIYSTISYYLIDNKIINTVMYLLLLTIGLIINYLCSIKSNKYNEDNKLIELVNKNNKISKSITV